MNPRFDDFDRGILSERQRARFRLDGIQEGDYIYNPKAGEEGKYYAFTDDAAISTEQLSEHVRYAANLQAEGV